MKLANFNISLDPRIKIISSFFFIFLVTTSTPTLLSFFSFLSIEISLIFINKIPFSVILKRITVIFPFVILVGIFLPFFSDKGEPIVIMGLVLDSWGLQRLIDICMKASLSVISLTILLETTAFPDIVKGLELLKVPQLMIIIISFIYRYFTIILKEGKRMKIARDVRSTGGPFSWQLKTMGNILGQLFIRSFERSEHIYHAMIVRGYSGTIQTMTTFHISVKDILFFIGVCIVLCTVRVIT